jgi:hypothetical protein
MHCAPQGRSVSRALCVKGAHSNRTKERLLGWEDNTAVVHAGGKQTTTQRTSRRGVAVAQQMMTWAGERLWLRYSIPTEWLRAGPPPVAPQGSCDD